jgi:hypothetical protein
MAVNPADGPPVAMVCTVPFTGPGGADDACRPVDTTPSCSSPPRTGWHGGAAIWFGAVRDRPPRPACAGYLRVHAGRGPAQHEPVGVRRAGGPGPPDPQARAPQVPMDEYVAWTRADGLPTDPWLRVHVRAGGRVVRVAPHSMTITGTLDDWRR